jgi:DNA-binding response OmpR family regulator
LTKILIVEDDEVLNKLVADWLLGSGYDVESAYDGKSAMDILRAGSFDIVLLDWDLPEKSGLDILREFRSRGGKARVIMLTAKNHISDKELGLDLGADDYLTKPFAIKELSARIRALLRRPGEVISDVVVAGDVQIELGKHRLTKNGLEIHLQPRDFSLLEFLMRYPNQIFSADVLLSRVWSTDSEASPDALRSSIKRIRKALDEPGDNESKSIIKTIPRVGYTLRVE